MEVSYDIVPYQKGSGWHYRIVATGRRAGASGEVYISEAHFPRGYATEEEARNAGREKNTQHR